MFMYLQIIYDHHSSRNHGKKYENCNGQVLQHMHYYLIVQQ